MAAWHEPPRRRRGSGYWLAFYVYLCALAGVFALFAHWLFMEVLAQWPSL